MKSKKQAHSGPGLAGGGSNRCGYDLIIVGAGPAGCSTALHALRDRPDLRLLLLDRARFPRDKLCAGGLTYYGEQILRDLGLELTAPAPHTAGPRYADVTEMQVRYRGELAVIRAEPVFRVFHRRAFDAWLLAHTRAAGAQVHTGTEVSAVERVGGGFQVTTADGDRFTARVVVGADGSRGIVRRLLGNAPRLSRLLEVVTPEDPGQTPEFLHGRALFDFSRMGRKGAALQGYYWNFPSFVEGRAMMNRGVFDARVCQSLPRANLPAVLDASLHEHGRRLSEVELRGHPLHWRRTESLAGPGLLLAGDAAGADPLLGEGISFALAYGRVAGRQAARAFARQRFDFRDYEQAVRSDPVLRILPRRRFFARLLFSLQAPTMLRFAWRRILPLLARFLLPRAVPGGVGGNLEISRPAPSGSG